MKRALLILMVLAVCTAVLSKGVSAYQIFSYNPNFDSNISGVSVYNEVNQTLNYSGTCDVKTGCLNMSSDGSYSSIYLYTIGSDDSHQQWTNATAMGAYDDTTHFLRHVLPRNKQGIVVFSYYFNESPEDFFQYLAVIDADTSVILGNANLSLTPNVWHTVTIIVPANTSDRSVRVFATFRWNSTPSTLMVDKFWFYTEDATEVRPDWTNNFTYESERYCGVGSLLTTDDPTDGNYSHIYGDNGYWFGSDSNSINCGFVKLGDLIIARHWMRYYTSPICNVQWSEYTPDLYFLKEHYSDTNIMLFESFLRTQVKMTLLYNETPFQNYYVFYDDMFNTNITVASFRYNYSNAFRQIISLVNNPNISISNQNPSGNNFRFGVDCAGFTYTPYHPFFTSNLQVENAGWSCPYITNTEFFITSGGEQVNSHYCGECGCAGDGFGFRCVQGANRWECHNAYEAWHYDDACANDLQLICNIRCEGGQCVGEQICANNSDCDNYCDGSILHYNPYCDFSTYTCRWYSSQNCTYGCNSYLGACNEQPPATPVFQNRTTQGIISEITGGVLGFLSFTANPFLSILFIAVVAIIIIGVFSLFAYIAKHIGDI